VKDQEASKRLVDEAVGLIKNEDRRKELSSSIAALGIKNADIIIAGKILGK
jgi:hypothetical protein